MKFMSRINLCFFTCLILMISITQASDDFIRLKSGAVIQRSTASSVYLTFNQIDVSNFPQISCFVAAVDGNGNPVSNLTKSNFVLKEKSSSISSFSVTSSGGVNLNASIGIVLDNSGSISDDKLVEINNAALGLINLLQNDDKASIFKFTEKVQMIQNFTNNKDLLNYAVNSPRISGNATAMNDAIYDAISLTKLEYARKAIVALTDGVENASTHSIQQVINYANTNQIPIFTIGLGDDVNENALMEIAESTGGSYFSSATTQNLLAIFESIGGAIGNQYEIQYSTPNPIEDCAIRSTLVQVNYGGSSDQKTKTYQSPCEGEITVELPKDIPCFPGSSIVLQIWIEDATGVGILSYQFNLQYNSNVLKARGARSTGTLTASWGAPMPSYPATNQIRVGGYGVSPLAGAGVLVEVMFDVIGQNGDYSPLTFLEFMFNSGNPPAKFIDGFVWVTALDVSGMAKYYGNSYPIPRVNTKIIENGANATTDNSGNYKFSNLARGQKYTIVPSKAADTDIGNLSILTHDAAYAAQAAMGLRTLTSYETIAADVDKNNKIGMYDAALIAQYAVDLPKTSDSHVGEWIFKEPEHKYEPLEGSMKNQDFIGILLGDVTDNWSLNTLPKSSNPDLQNWFTWISSSEIELNLKPDIEDELTSMDLSIRLDKPEGFVDKVTWSPDFSNWNTFSHYKNGVLKLGAYTLSNKVQGQYSIKLKFAEPLLQNSTCNLEKLLFNGQLIAANKQIQAETALPLVFNLEQNYPNPFNPATSISFSLPETAFTELSIFNSLGQKVRTLVDEWKQAGSFKITWDGLNDNAELVSQGIYFLKLDSGNFHKSIKMILVQ